MTTTTTELLDRLKQAGVTVEAVGDTLSCGPRSRLTPELAEAVKAHKADILARLRPPPSVHPRFDDVWDGPGWYFTKEWPTW